MLYGVSSALCLKSGSAGPPAPCSPPASRRNTYNLNLQKSPRPRISPTVLRWPDLILLRIKPAYNTRTRVKLPSPAGENLPRKYNGQQLVISKENSSKHHKTHSSWPHASLKLPPSAAFLHTAVFARCRFPPTYHLRVSSLPQIWTKGRFSDCWQAR